jgi:hypothetical protein
VARPTVIKCEVCEAEVPVSAKGRVPRFCGDHSAADLAGVVDLRTDTEREADETAELASRQAAGPVVAVDDGWPQHVAPIVWVDQDGRRYTDHGDAVRGAQEIRERDG